MLRLADKTVVVTGATGIAASAAIQFALEGAEVFIISNSESDCASLTQRIGSESRKAEYAVADLTIESETVAAFAAASERYGRIDGLYAVVGSSGRRFGDGPIHHVPLEGWRQTMSLNVDPPFLAGREALKMMLEQQPVAGSRGSILMVTSVLAVHPSPGLFATHSYTAAKGAIIALTKTMASYYAPHLVRVNSIAPGLVATPMSQRAAENSEIVDYARWKQPLAKGMLHPEDIVGAALFFLSDDSTQVTGQVLEVDGGWAVTEASP